MSGEGAGDKASRPSSLLLDAPQPEREPLHFDVQLLGAPPEVEQLVNNIKQVAEEFLYHWKTFPIAQNVKFPKCQVREIEDDRNKGSVPQVLPASRFTNPGDRPCDIIIPPPCDELDAAALDAGPEPQRLSPKQLHSIRERGEFEVPSRHFPGQTHVWRVAGWLQRGRVRAREQLYRHVACALALVAVTARDRLLADAPLSLRAGARALLAGLRALLDLLVGMPSLEARDLDKRIREERARYLVAELICKPEHREDLAALAAWVSRAMRRAAAEKADGREPARAAPPVPCIYTTPQRTHIDLRLYRRELLRRAAPALQNILDREARGWFLHFRERHAARLAGQKMPLKEIEEEVREAAMEEYVSRVCAAVLGSEALAALGDGVPELLAAQLRASAVMARAEESARRRLDAGVAAAEARLRTAHPLLSRAPAWRRERLAAATERLRAELRWAAHEEALAALGAHKLPQHRYFLARDLAFLREREPLLAAELVRARSPTRRFRWARRVWSAARWRVTRHGRGRAERVPTVLGARAAPQPAPRSDPAQPVFLVARDVLSETSTRYAGWRLANLAHRAYCWTWNVMYVLGVLVPWCSPLALRTLICLEPFYVDYELSQVNGTLYPKRSSETPTMWSRLLDLWRHVARERRKFDTEPDTGLVGKGMSRMAHLVWMYGCVGGAGSAALLLLWPVCCVTTCVASGALAAGAPLWAPPAALAWHAGCALLYDADAPRAASPRVLPAARAALLQVAALGLAQAALALLLAVLIVPAALLLVALALLAEGCRALWERGAWAWLARGARVPARGGRAVRRVAGPGLLAAPALRLEAAPALGALAARAELDALAAWAADAERLAERPLREYRQFVAACFGPFSVRIAETGTYRTLQRECAELVAELRAAVGARRAQLACPLSEAQRRRVRLEHADLAVVVEAGGAQLARVWAAGARAAGDEWWAGRGLDAGDWTGLAANTLADAFSPDVLVPLEAGAAALPLEAGPGARAWEPPAARPPDVLAGVARWAAAAPRLPPPALDASAFSPRHPRHPPLPAPALAALVLHNRDADAPVPLESPAAGDVLRALEDAPDADDARDSVERYRGGGSSGSSCSLSDEEERRPPASPPAPPPPPSPPAGPGARGACRWTLTGRGVRLRADLASPEDVTLDTDRRGTSV